MGANIGVVLAYSAGIMLIFMVSWLFVKPIKFLGRLLLNSLLGALVLIVFNYFGQFTGVCIGVNEATALTIGLLGIPGFIALLVLKILV
ncbi:MAG: pro-sigmaK processing inhibitor BofA family protein [Sedimentibacter sp.]|uniref:pro-sigmaK processing inhibitor BofA family protein n=1 Tax=Sedimentibacter sp. TaxID=1960295 RepID=UPI003158600D